MVTSYVAYWIDRRRRLEKTLGGLLKREQAEIEEVVAEKVIPLRSVLEDESMPGNGIEKVIGRERKRLCLNEVSSRTEPLRGDHPGMVFVPGGDTTIGVAGDAYAFTTRMSRELLRKGP